MAGVNVKSEIKPLKKVLLHRPGKARGLKGRTLGIIGLGSIGKAVARRALGLDR